MQLVRPSAHHLGSYAAALRRGGSADHTRGLAAATEELRRIEDNPDDFLAAMEDREAKGPPVTLPDGSVVTRLPGFRRWMWDGEFVGSIGLRWRPRTTALPPHCLGHISYAVVPWHQRKGHATSLACVGVTRAALRRTAGARRGRAEDHARERDGDRAKP